MSMQANLPMVSQALKAALGSGASDDWVALSLVFASRLNRVDRVALAWAVLRTLDEDDLEDVLATVLGPRGMPLPTVLSPLNDARWWAEGASRNELKAYCFACFEALTANDRAAFRELITRKPAA